MVQIKLTKTASKDVVHAGESFTYTITADSGTQTTPGNVTLTDAVPALFGGQNFTKNLGAFRGNVTTTIPVTVSSTDVGAFQTQIVRNTANLTCGTYTTEAFVDVKIEGVTIEKSASAESVGELAPFSFIVRVANPALVPTPVPVTVTDPSLVGMIESSVSMSGGGTSSGDSFDFGILPAHGSGTATITGRPMLGTANTTFVNVATLNSPYAGNATASIGVLDLGYCAVTGGAFENREGASNRRYGFIQLPKSDGKERARVTTWALETEKWDARVNYSNSGSGAVCPDWVTKGDALWESSTDFRYEEPLDPSDPKSPYTIKTDVIACPCGGEVEIMFGEGYTPARVSSSHSWIMDSISTDGESTKTERTMESTKADTSEPKQRANWTDTFREAGHVWAYDLGTGSTVYSSTYTPVDGADPIWSDGPYVGPPGPVEQGGPWWDTPIQSSSKGKGNRFYSEQTVITPTQAKEDIDKKDWKRGGGALKWTAYVDRKPFSYKDYNKFYDYKFKTTARKRKFTISLPPLLAGDEFVLTGDFLCKARTEKKEDFSTAGKSYTMTTAQQRENGKQKYYKIGEPLHTYASAIYGQTTFRGPSEAQMVELEVEMGAPDPPSIRFNTATTNYVRDADSQNDPMDVTTTFTLVQPCGMPGDDSQVVYLSADLRKLVTTYKPAAFLNDPSHWVSNMDVPPSGGGVTGGGGGGDVPHDDGSDLEPF